MLQLVPGKAFNSKAASWRSGDWTVADITYHEIVFDTEFFDQLAEYSILTGRFTVKQSGYYMVAFSAGLESLGDGKKIIVQLRKNGTTNLAVGRTIVGGTDWIAQGSSVITKLTVGDYVSVFIYHNHGGTLTGISDSSTTFMTIHRLS